jgi:predicted RNA-binding protein Jag
MPFILTLTPSYVAHALGKTPPIMLPNIQEYVQRNAEHLKSVAHNAKMRGLNAQVLE